MADARQKARFDEPSPRRTAKHGTRENQSVEANEVLPVKRLDGEVVWQGEIPFAGGMHCEVWVGRWEKVEKMSPGLTTPYPTDGPL